MSDITDALDRIFTNAEEIIDSLRDEFTSQAFLRRVIHDQQHAYIDLLVACQHLEMPFDQAHQEIGERLSRMMAKRSFSKARHKNKDENIFRRPTMLTIYRRSH